MSVAVRLKRAALAMSFRVPERVRLRLAGSPPRNDRGVALDADVHWMLFLEKRLGSGIAGGTVAQARAGMRESTAVVQGRAHPLRSRRDESIGGVPCRRYTPLSGQGARLMYMHGGGWAVGDLDTHDRFCQRLAAEGGVEVIAVHYALAPERPYPAGLDDVLAVYRALRVVDGPLAMGGDSAGGNLAAAASLSLRADGLPLPDLQLLIYPGLDMVRTFASHREFASGFMLEAESIGWYIEQYGAPDHELPLVSPWYEADLTGLPEAIVVTAGFDPLRDEGQAFAERLREAGVGVTELRAVDQVHGFVNMDGAVRGADEAAGKIVDALRDWAAGH